MKSIFPKEFLKATNYLSNRQKEGKKASLLSISRAVLGWREPLDSDEYTNERLRRIESRLLSYVGDSERGGPKQMTSMLDAQIVDIIVERGTRVAIEEIAHIGAIRAHLARHIRDFEVGIEVKLLFGEQIGDSRSEVVGSHGIRRIGSGIPLQVLEHRLVFIEKIRYYNP